MEKIIQIEVDEEGGFIVLTNKGRVFTCSKKGSQWYEISKYPDFSNK